jgi:hypothetical protein
MSRRHRNEDDVLRAIILRAIEAEGVPLPAIWKGNVIELCLRVVDKLIGVDEAIVRIAVEAVKVNATTPHQPAKDQT